MLDTVVPWDACKIGFGVQEDPELYWRLLGRHNLPVGWELRESSTACAQCVLIFEVEGQPTAAAGRRVAELIAWAERVVPPSAVSGHEFRVVEVNGRGEFTLEGMHPRTRRLIRNRLYGGAVASDLQVVDIDEDARKEEVRELLRVALAKADEYGLEVRPSEDGLQRVFSVEPHRLRSTE